MSMTTAYVLEAIQAERDRQTARFGVQSYPVANEDVLAWALKSVGSLRQQCDDATAQGAVTWTHILFEELAEALAETDPVARRIELVQLAAVIVAAIESEDRAAQKPFAATEACS